jgi:Uma2 family endonuclease
MSIATRRLGLADHGKPVEQDEFEVAEFEEGFKYELIEGSLYVTPAANLPEDRNGMWLLEKLIAYKARRPRAINYLSQNARVFVPGRPAVTSPEPDISAYRAFPLRMPLEEVDWENVSPILVIEILFDADPHKDLVRNVELYLRVPSIREYWVLDARHTPSRPTLIVHRRRGKKWVRREYLYGETYETKLLPGFSLRIDPRR